MICETCRYNDPPGFVRCAGSIEPCPDCGGTQVAHCCDGLTACNDPVPPDVMTTVDAADEHGREGRRPAELSASRN